MLETRGRLAGGASARRGRWLAAWGCTAALHALAATALLLPWRRAVEPVAMIAVELVAAPAAVPDVVPEPVPVAAPLPAPEPAVPPVAVPVAKPVTRPVTRPVTGPVTRPVTRPVTGVAAPVTAPVAAPVAVASGPALAPVAVVSSAWRLALAGWIAARKSYPLAARRRGTEGVVTLRFTVERSGQVVEVAVIRSSGSETLDDAALAVLRAAQVPAFPPEMTQARTTETVNLGYSLTAPAG